MMIEDPTGEALLYQPARASLMKPLSDNFYRNCIASGSIVPPSGESAAVRRTDFAVGLCALCLIACGVMAILVALYWRG